MSFQQNSFQQNAFQSGLALLPSGGPVGAGSQETVADSKKWRQLGSVDPIPNLLITVILASVALRGPTFAEKQDLSHPKLRVQAEQVINRLPLGGSAPVVSPFVPEEFKGPLARPYLPIDTSHGTPKVLFEDVSFAPAQSEFQTIPRPVERYADTSYRNEALLNQPVVAPFLGKEFPTIPRPIQVFGDTSYRNNSALAPAATAPFVPVDFSNIPWQKWLPADTSKGSSEALLNPNPFWGYPQVSAPVLIRTLPDTSQSSPRTLFVEVAPPFIGYVAPGTPDLKRGVVDTSKGTPLPLLTAPVAAPFYNPTFDVIRPPFNVLDTSKGTPLTLLTAQVFPPFYQSDWPAPIEYRFLTHSTNDPQTFPEFIPPPIPPEPPVTRVEIGGGIKKHKSAKKEREEFLDEVVREVLVPAKPAPELPVVLQPVAQVVSVVSVQPLSIPPVIELPPENDEETIAALIALGLF